MQKWSNHRGLVCALHLFLKNFFGKYCFQFLFVTSFSDYMSFSCLCNGHTWFAGSDDFGNSWFSRVSTSITSWMSQASSSFTFIWDKNVPESSQFSDATGSGDGTLANGQNATNSSARVFTLAKLRAATYNFRSDMLLGKGGFGDVYKRRSCLQVV